MVREPRAFLLDEPLSNLDAKLRSQMRTEIARLQRRLGTTTVYVTHDQAEAMTLGDHIAVLRRGRLQQVGTPRGLYQEPANLFVAGFIGSPAMNFLPARIRGDRLVLPMVELPLPEELRESVDAQGSGGYIAGIRPEHFRTLGNGDRHDTSPSTFQVPVDLVEWMGAELYVHFQVSMEEAEGLDAAADKLRSLAGELELEEPGGESRQLVARLDPGSPAVEGESLELTLDAGKILLFDPETGERISPPWSL
jgi:multiple sugar transport system ATP-binding protein